jgi:hypothetical protein
MTNVILDLWALLLILWPILVLFTLIFVTLKNVLGKSPLVVKALKARAKQDALRGVRIGSRTPDMRSQAFLSDLQGIQKRVTPRSPAKFVSNTKTTAALRRYSPLQYFFFAWTVIWLFVTVVTLVPLLLNAYYYLPNLPWCLYFGAFTGLGALNFKKGR